MVIVWSMKIRQRTADRLKKENHAQMAVFLNLNYGFDLTRQAVNVWMQRRSIPDKYIDGVQDYAGIKIR